ncbi:putative effector of murein hydrolase [Thermococcus kodakarensis KOD1]|uniref:Effector of murein hydrolase n=1 Tax=Thermococcus kodakarensis (strain ATCC BAA-918 / JCM 12380 / KOD1) TaxID=69014 RepID=Q5JHH3_THEKO|nr:CidB/LrgB family autolysis modulator [Thermococcus kodakarensis]WCN27993.1 CidB/LrgB family autolysis modulator [Thermococcus kodakarensis]WCN30292.1 CidB/LrgB family autolysis modulator [Thermococcus kodakarensis]BAD86339.1 putative effector of murein hydrolase [Thermococcus kodakarensis KOD1]
MNPYGMAITLVVFYVFSELHARRKAFYTNPVLLSIATIAAFLWFGGFSYDSYMESAGILKFLLGPAVVSLAVPVYRGLDTIKAYWKEIAAGITVGGTVAILSAFYTAEVLGGSSNVLLSIAPKSVTTAIAIGISEKIGGIPSLTAVLVILTGILGNAVGPELLNVFRVRDRVARGLAMGVTSHGLGTARILLEDEIAGGVSGLAMALNGVFTALVLPYLIKIL